VWRTGLNWIPSALRRRSACYDGMNFVPNQTTRVPDGGVDYCRDMSLEDLQYYLLLWNEQQY
jgi:hypothetical protein